MPSNCLLCTSCKHYRSSTNFITNRYRALYKTYKSYKVNPFFTLLIYCLSNSIYIGEKKGMVLMIFSRPSAAYKPAYSRYYFRRCLHRCFSPYTARIDLATAYTNPAATCYGPPYYGLIRYWAYYYSPPYCGAARLWSNYYHPPYYRAGRS